MRDDIHIKEPLFDAIHRQGNTIQGDRTLRREKAQEGAVRSKVEARGPGHRRYIKNLGDPIDMPIDQMPAQLIAEPQRALQIDFLSLAPVSDGGLGKSLF